MTAYVNDVFAATFKRLTKVQKARLLAYHNEGKGFLVTGDYFNGLLP